MEDKKCSKCKKIKPISEFCRNRGNKDGLHYQCKECERKVRKENLNNYKEYQKNWKKNNPEYYKNYYINNREKLNKRSLKYNKLNPFKVRKYSNKWRKDKIKKDPKFRLRLNISTIIWQSIKQNKKSIHWENLVGYNLKDLMVHLEKLFKSGMSWSNYGKWHIDHRKPVSSFNFTSPEDPEFKQCWALKNLQPLWAMDNFVKNNK